MSKIRYQNTQHVVARIRWRNWWAEHIGDDSNWPQQHPSVVTNIRIESDFDTELKRSKSALSSKNSPPKSIKVIRI